MTLIDGIMQSVFVSGIKLRPELYGISGTGDIVKNLLSVTESIENDQDASDIAEDVESDKKTTRKPWHTEELSEEEQTDFAKKIFNQAAKT